MTDAPLIIALDTSGPHCAGAVLRGSEVLAKRLEPMTRGQAERLMPMLEDILEEARIKWSDASAIGVGTGPGNFTGLRIAVSAARGLALGLGVPVVGVTGFEARARIVPAGLTPAIPAPRDQVYLDTSDGPELVPRDQINHAIWAEDSPEELAIAIARVTATRWQSKDIALPAPLYVRPADAAPARDRPPELLDG